MPRNATRKGNLIQAQITQIEKKQFMSTEAKAGRDRLVKWGPKVLDMIQRQIDIATIEVAKIDAEDEKRRVKNRARKKRQREAKKLKD
jgi:7,8-dihydro-6-hydroxymethylpterin-pyrophosphokinase